MDYERLALPYWNEQVARIENIRLRIAEQDEAIRAGRVVPETADLVIGSGRQLRMAVMFLDICGFSQRPSENSSEQETILRVLNLFFTEMIRVAEEYGGTVEKNTGDGLMTYFEDGAGNPPEDGCKRALSCALTMMHTNTALINPIIQASGLEEIHFRVGIDYGIVTAGRLGAAGRFGALVAIGTTANIASKMLSVAGVDEILLGESVFNQLPQDRRQRARLHQLDTGWVYRQTRAAYPFYRYDGRWTGPM